MVGWLVGVIMSWLVMMEMVVRIGQNIIMMMVVEEANAAMAIVEETNAAVAIVDCCMTESNLLVDCCLGDGSRSGDLWFG